MARKIPQSPSLLRRTAFLEPKVEIVIACEGKRTEPRYFEACVYAYSAGMVRLRIIPETGVPITVVKAAIAERAALLADARKAAAAERRSFRVWAVFDRDEHDVDEALELARREKIDVAFSNPCFELWPVLHLQDYGSQNSRHELQRHLRSIMPNYDHNGSAEVDFDLIRDKVTTAIRRAQLLELSREEEGCPLGTPCTTVHRLVRKILENGDITSRKIIADIPA